MSLPSVRTALALPVLIGLLAILAPAAAHSQSADLILCDRLAADPVDPDRPADIPGVVSIAAADISTAIKFCKQTSPTRRSLYQLGRAYAAAGRTADAIAALRKAADRGSSSAMVELGVAFANGAGVTRDDTQARALFERAAAAGNPRGISNLTALSGAAANPAQSRVLLARAAETNAEAQYQLGMMMAEGDGGAKDDAGARVLFEKAAMQNHPAALERMGAFAQSGRGGSKDSSTAKAYYERAAALGNSDAKAALDRLKCPYVIKDKKGGVVTTLCF